MRQDAHRQDSKIYSFLIAFVVEMVNLIWTFHYRDVSWPDVWRTGRFVSGCFRAGKSVIVRDQTFCGSTNEDLAT